MRQALVVALCLVAAGCVTSHMQRLDPVVRPARTPDSIAVFETAPERSYTVIARIESQTDAVFKDYADLRTKIIDEAAQLGGEAVIMGPESRETTFLILPTAMIPSEKKKLTGEVIVFSRGAAAPTP